MQRNHIVLLADTVSVVTIIAGSTMFLYGWQSEPQAPLFAFLSLQASLSGQGATAAVAVNPSVSSAIGMLWWGITIAAGGFLLMIMRYRMGR